MVIFLTAFAAAKVAMFISRAYAFSDWKNNQQGRNYWVMLARANGKFNFPSIGKTI
jgi:hypothetical protein